MLRFEMVLFMLLGTCVTKDITSKRKHVLKELSIIILNSFHYCHSTANYSKETLDDAVMFWEPNYPLKHTEFGCAALCVSIILHITDPDGEVNLRNTAAFLKYKGADEEMTKTMNDLGLYCRNTISLLNVTVEPCWIALEFIRCVRDGIEDLGWVPNAYDVNQGYSDFLIKINQEVGRKLHGNKTIVMPDGSTVEWTPLKISNVDNMRRMLPSSQLPSTTNKPKEKEE